MKRDIRKLYKKDPDLARQAAKALGYTITTSKSVATIDKALKKGIERLSKDMGQILATIDSIDGDVKEKVNGLLPTDVSTAGRAVLDEIANYRNIIQKYLKWKVKDKK